MGSGGIAWKHRPFVCLTRVPLRLCGKYATAGQSPWWNGDFCKILDGPLGNIFHGRFIFHNLMQFHEEVDAFSSSPRENCSRYVDRCKIIIIIGMAPERILVFKRQRVPRISTHSPFWKVATLSLGCVVWGSPVYLSGSVTLFPTGSLRSPERSTPVQSFIKVIGAYFCSKFKRGHPIQLVLDLQQFIQ